MTTKVCKISCYKRKTSHKTKIEPLWLSEFDRYSSSFKFSTDSSQAKIIEDNSLLIDEIVSHLKESWGMQVFISYFEISFIETIEF